MLPSDVYVRSFLYLFYTLIKLYYTKVQNDQALSLAPDWNPLPQEAKCLSVFHGSATTFQTGAEAETPILWLPNAKNWLIEKNSDAGKDWGKRRRGWQRTRWLDGIIESMDVSLTDQHLSHPFFPLKCSVQENDKS